MAAPTPTHTIDSATATIDRLARHASYMAATRDNANIHLPHLFYVTDRQTARQLAATVEILPPGSGIIFRHYTDENRSSLARELVALCQPRKLKLLIAGTPALARQVGAYGVHLPEYLIPRARHIRRTYPMLTISAAVHTQPALRAAISCHVDALLISPIFPTRSHSNAKTLGPYRLAALCTHARSLNPHIARIAMGGINADNAARLIPTAATGIAGISMFEN